MIHDTTLLIDAAFLIGSAFHVGVHLFAAAHIYNWASAKLVKRRKTRNTVIVTRKIMEG